MKNNILLYLGILVAVIVISGCAKDIKTSELYISPSANIEATVIELVLDEEINKPYCNYCPHDEAKIKIDKIEINNDPYSRIHLSVGDEIEVKFKYSARPAIVKKDIESYCLEGDVLKEGSCYPKGADPNDPTTMVSRPIYDINQPNTFSDGYIMYHIPTYGNPVSESILPGLSIGQKIKADRIYPESVTPIMIELYEVI